MSIRYRSATYVIGVDNTAQCNSRVARLTADGAELVPAEGLILEDDGRPIA